MDWRKALYRYVRAYNQWEMNYDADHAAEWLLDKAYLSSEKKRLERMKQAHQEKGRVPLRNETKMKIDRWKESGTAVDVQLTLKRKMWYRIQNHEHEEERLERLSMKWQLSTAGRWRCREIKRNMPDPEARLLAAMHGAPAQSGAHFPTEKVSSAPYLNYRLIYPTATRFQYDRECVREYADMWWDHPNPEYVHFDVDCTNYVSQCIFAGGAPMNYTGRRDAGWWYRRAKPNDNWSFSWSVAHSLHWFLADGGLSAEEVKSASELMIGDVIFYDFQGDSRYDHSTIVTAFDPAGMPLVNAHTSNSKHRYWDYKDSTAWTERIKYRFFDIADRA